MKICICDDDRFSVGEIRSRLSAFNAGDDAFDISDFSCGEDLLEYYKAGGGFDIIFIGMEMRGINAVETAERIREVSPEVIFIFVSAYSDCILEAFRIESLYFLAKPVRDEEFAEVFTRAMKRYTALNASILLKWESTRNKIAINKISYVEGYRRHLTVHTAHGEFEAVGKMSEIQQLLNPHGFVRVHQGFVVNMNYIKSFGINEIELTDGSVVPVSVRKKHEALKAYDIFMKKWSW